MNLGNLGGLRDLAAGMFGGGERPAAPSAPAAAPQTSMVDLVERRYRYASDAKRELLEIWATCLAFYCGEQWRKWEPQTRRLVRPDRIPSWRVQMVDNQIPGILDTGAAKLARSRQIPRALANTDDPEDQQAASLGTHALNHWWHKRSFEARELEANFQRMLFGCAFFHDYWDPRVQGKVPVQDFAQDPQTGAWQPRMVAKRAPVGDVCVEVLSVFDVFPEPCEAFEDISWCIVARRRPLHWFRTVFGDQARQVEADRGDVQDAFSSLVPGAELSGNGGAAPPDGDGLATLKTYYEAASPEHPQGRCAMVAGKQLLWEGPLPLPHGEIPVAMMRYRYVPKRMWPLGLVETMLGQQRELNRGQSVLAEVLRLFAGPKWLVKKGAVPPRSITSQPGEVIEYTSQDAPVMVPPPNIPQYLAVYPEQQREAMRHLAGQRDLSPDGIPPGVTAASALSLIEEQSNVRLSTPARYGKEALEQLFRRVLVTIVERYREPRLISTYGRNRAGQVMTVLGADIGDRDVMVDLTEGVADTDATRGVQLQEWIGQGLFDLVGSPLLPLVTQLMRDVGQPWLADVLDQAGPQIQQAMLQQQLEAAAAEQDAKAAEGEQQVAQAAEEADRQAQEAEAQRAHETELAQVQGDVQLAAAAMRNGNGPKRKGEQV